VGELIEAEGVEVVGWDDAGEHLLYRTLAAGDGEGAVVGVALAPSGKAERYLVSLATDPGAAPVLRDQLLAAGVHADPTPFHQASARARRRYVPGVEAANDLSTRFVTGCDGTRVTVMPGDALDAPDMVGAWVSSAGAGWVVVRSEGRLGTAPATLSFGTLPRSLDVYANADGQAVVDALKERLGEAWTVRGPLPVRRRVAQTTLRGRDEAMLRQWWSTLGVDGEPVIESMDVGEACAALVLPPAVRPRH